MIKFKKLKTKEKTFISKIKRTKRLKKEFFVDLITKKA